MSRSKAADPEARNNEIVERINLGEKPADLARFFGIERERVRQIYKRLTGVNPIITLRPIRDLKKIIKKDAVLDAALECALCHKTVTRRHLYQFNKYCLECRVKLRESSGNNRVPISRTCDLEGCDIVYYPRSSSFSKLSKGLIFRLFCSRAHSIIGNKGRKCTPKSLGKMSIAQTRRWAKIHELQRTAKGLLSELQLGDKDGKD